MTNEEKQKNRLDEIVATINNLDNSPHDLVEEMKNMLDELGRMFDDPAVRNPAELRRINKYQIIAGFILSTGQTSAESLKRFSNMAEEILNNPENPKL